MKELAVHFSSATCEWATPQWLFDVLAREFAFTLDPCATRENAKCPRFFTLDDDGLVQTWGDEIVFMNPPYGVMISRWMWKAYKSSRAGATVGVPGSRSNRHRMVAPLRDEGRSAVAAWPAQIRQRNELRAVPECHRDLPSAVICFEGRR